MKHIHICISVDAASGGLQPAIIEFAAFQEHIGHDVEIWVLKDDKSSGAERLAALATKVRLRVFPAIGPVRIGLSMTMCIAALRIGAPAILHLHGLWSLVSVAARIGALKRKALLVVHPHGMLNPEARRNHWLLKWLLWVTHEKSLVQMADLIRVLSQDEQILIKTIDSRINTMVLPNGVLPPHEITETTRVCNRSVLYLGRLHPIKRIDSIVNGWIESNVDSKGWKLTIAGWGKKQYIDNLEEIVWRHSTVNSIQFVGPVFGSAKDALYRASTIFIINSASEAHPVAALEAMSYGCMVLAGRRSGLEQAIEQGAAIAIEDEEHGVATALRSLTTLSKQDYERITKNAIAFTKSKYDWRMLVQMFDERLAQMRAM